MLSTALEYGCVEADEAGWLLTVTTFVEVLCPGAPLYPAGTTEEVEDSTLVVVSGWELASGTLLADA